MITLYQNIDGNQYLTKHLDHSRFLLMHDIKKYQEVKPSMANKAELIEKVAAATDLTKKDATAAVDAVFSTIQDALANGEKSSIDRLW